MALKFVYHESLPRILLVDFDEKDLGKLRQMEFNFKEATFSYTPHLEGKAAKTFSTEQKINEIDIVILNASSSAETDFDRNFTANGEVCPTEDLTGFILAHTKGFFIIFVGDNAEKSIQRFFPLISVHDTKFKVAKTPHAFNEEYAENPFFDFIKNNFKNADKYFAVKLSKEISGVISYVFLMDDLQNSYVKMLRVKLGIDYEPFVIFLPLYKDLVGKIKYILEKILPKVRPSLFPARKQFDWLFDKEFLPPEVINIAVEIEKIKKVKESEINKKQEEIMGIIKARKYLFDLLSTKGDKLKESCGRVLEEIMEKTREKFSLVDVDKSDDMKDIDKRLKEDYRMKLNDKVILIDISGSEGNFGHGILNTLTEHRRIFMKYHPEYKIDNIFSVAILNHQIEIRPSGREELFGNIIEDISERIEKDCFSIISTYELYKLHKNTDKMKLPAEQIIEFLTKSGIKKFEEFFATGNRKSE